jgi:hypothetical protein
MEPRGQEIILDTLDTTFEKSRKIWAAIYESAGRELPSFFNRKIEEHQMQDSIEDKKDGSSINVGPWTLTTSMVKMVNMGRRFWINIQTR